MTTLLPRLLPAIVALLLTPSILAEQQSTPVAPSISQALTWGYLGLKVDTVPAAVKAHFPDSISKIAGLIVTQLSDESPAADDGIKLYDVLISYDEQPIEKSQQFIETIKKDVPGRIVKIKVLRQGEILTIPITIGGQHQAPVTQAPKQQAPVTNAANTQYMPRNQPYSGRGYSPSYRGYPVSPRPMTQQVPNYNALRMQPYGKHYPPPNPYMQNHMQSNVAKPVQKAPPVQRLNIVGKPAFPMRKKIKKTKKAWGDERHIWPDTYTDFTGDLWDSMMNAPFDIGRMPGGWRAPSLSTPDPVTVGDAVTNQLPPIMEEMGNMTNFTN